jgi:centrosomal protein CEP41
LDALILDVRDPEDYAQCHINGALNYPAIKLRRDQYIPELYQYKNKDGKIIVLYDNDGVSKLGIDAATSFIEKLFSNTVLLSGGLLGIAERYPERLFGKLPPQLQLELDAMIKQNAKYSRSTSVIVTHRPDTASSSRTSVSRLTSASAVSRATSISSKPWK